MLFRSNNRSVRHRFVVLMMEIILFMLIYLGVRAWMQRDLVDGIVPAVAQADLKGNIVSLADYQSEPLLLHFWASWCKICQFEQGAISSVADKWPVLTVAMESGSDEQVTHFMQENELDWNTINDESGEISDQFGIRGVPTSFIIDASGKIKFRESGYTTAAGLKLRLWLASLL